MEIAQWISFDLDMVQVAVHEGSGTPLEDVALFAGQVPAGTAGQPRDLGLMLCGSAQHLRTRVCAEGRMGSDTTWPHDVILEIERREENAPHAIPEVLNELMPHRRGEVLVEDAAFAVHGWIASAYSSPAQGRLRDHALVLRDLDRTRLPYLPVGHQIDPRLALDASGEGVQALPATAARRPGRIARFAELRVAVAGRRCGDVPYSRICIGIYPQ